MKKINKPKKKTVVAVSGGFDPIHKGHVRLFAHAKSLGDELLVIINNDNWLTKKKGFVFMPQEERAEVIKAIKYVDRVVLTGHGKDPQDMSVSKDLVKHKPHIFANGGDRFKYNVPEDAACRLIGCRMVFNIGDGGKVQSSSWLIEKAISNVPRKIGVKISKKKK
jgi:D-beta-D-heptose 7-phosphate kinase/D-beta-D-heptose 1-phosphate adenosyltransferase